VTGKITPDPKIIITIDGYSGCGKSTLAKDLSKHLSYLHIDTGAMYRSIALHSVRNNISVSETSSIIKNLSNIDLQLKFVNGSSIPYLNGEPVGHLLQSKEVVNIVSEIAAITEVREFLKEKQRNLGKNKGIVMDGRDIGTIIFPEASLKIFVTADIKIRTERRIKELAERGIARDAQEVQSNLEKRDRIDSNRKIAPLKKATDAIVLDTSHLTREEQLKKVLELVEQVISAIK